jgi:hypothetical protein
MFEENYSKNLFLLAAKPLVSIRRATGCFLKKDLPFQKDGLFHFSAGALVDLGTAEAGSLEIRGLLDRIEDLHVQNPEAHRASYSGEDYSYEFISENKFYCEKLGPRLRVSFKTNHFESWPKLAREILSSEAYRRTLRQNCGPLDGVFKCYIEKTFTGETEPQWHVDSVSQIARLIFFLNPVSDKTAPMEYLTGSHLDTEQKYAQIKSRHLKTAESWTENSIYSGDNNLKQLTGQAYESYLFDARGVHRAGLSTQVPRYILMISFTPKNIFNWFFDLNRGGWPNGTRKLKNIHF